MLNSGKRRISGVIWHFEHKKSLNTATTVAIQVTERYERMFNRKAFLLLAMNTRLDAI